VSLWMVMLVGFIIPLCSVMGSLQATHDDG
jgi:hypothetical protein